MCLLGLELASTAARRNVSKTVERIRLDLKVKQQFVPVIFCIFNAFFLQLKSSVQFSRSRLVVITAISQVIDQGKSECQKMYIQCF